MKASGISRRQAIAGAASFGISAAALRFGGARARSVSQPNNKNATQAASRTPPWLSLPPTPTLPADAKSELAAINGTRIFYAQWGLGKPVLLLHGGLANSNYWGHQVEFLAQNHHVIAMDTHGHGRSPLTTKAFSYALLAEDAAALMDHLHIERAAVIGWSDGAVTGLQLAITKPERITRLFAFGANVTLDGLIPGGAKSPVFASYAARCRQEYAQLSPHPEKWPELVAGLRVMWRTEPQFSRQKLGRSDNLRSRDSQVGANQIQR